MNLKRISNSEVFNPEIDKNDSPWEIQDVLKHSNHPFKILKFKTHMHQYLDCINSLLHLEKKPIIVYYCYFLILAKSLERRRCSICRTY